MKAQLQERLKVLEATLFYLKGKAAEANRDVAAQEGRILETQNMITMIEVDEQLAGAKQEDALRKVKRKRKVAPPSDDVSPAQG